MPGQRALFQVLEHRSGITVHVK